MDNKNPFQKYLLLRAQQLKLDLDAATLFTGTTEQGSLIEDGIRRFLKSSLPARYSIGLGEIITTPDQASTQTDAKDVVIFDANFSPILSWGETGFHLFPIESVYAVIEVKKTITTAELSRGLKQAIEARKLRNNFSRPFTAVIAMESKILSTTLLQNISNLSLEDRVDFVLIVKPKDTPTKSDYIAHWWYKELDTGKSLIEFAIVDKVYNGRLGKSNNNYRLTLGSSEDALLWFYLFLISSINAIPQEPVNLWKYAEVEKIDLGYIFDLP